MVREALGPEAVILSVRPLEPSGLSRLWQSARVEVLACVGDTTEIAAASPAPPIEEPITQRVRVGEGVGSISLEEPRPRAVWEGSVEATREARERLKRSTFSPVTPSGMGSGPVGTEGGGGGTGSRGWSVGHGEESIRLRCEPLLLRGGWDAVLVERVLERVTGLVGEGFTGGLAEELEVVGEVLRSLWGETTRNPRWGGEPRKRVLIGPAGVGKTTALCKWMTREYLRTGTSMRVWRLDGVVANTAEVLSVYAEVCGASVHRHWEPVRGPGGGDGAVEWVDLPGIDWTDRGQVEELRGLVEVQGEVGRVLVLNAAYDSAVLQAQVRAFSGIELEGVIVTHMDEVQRYGGIWNVVLGTKVPGLYFSSGQNIPGGFDRATPDFLISKQLHGNKVVRN